MNQALRTIPLVLLALVCLQTQFAIATDKPSVIIVMTDDQGYGDLGCHGNPILKTPNLDAMYRESIRFTDFHVSSFCTPTRAALMTGNYPGYTGAFRTSSGRTMMHRDEKTIANLFADNGYATGMIGKWHLGDNAPHRPQDRGFQDVVWHRCGGIGQGAKITIAGQSMEQPVHANSKGVLFEVELPAGPTDLVTYLYDKNGKAGGAYFTEESLDTVSRKVDQDARSAKPRYDGSWKSLQKMPVPAWFDDGKIGIFIHWGPYSAIGYRKGGRGYAEHVPKMIYRDPDHYFPFVKERWGSHPPEFGYKDIIPEFKAENWNPDEWAELFEEVGAKYVVMTAEHHDGWANWDSDLTPWNAVDMGPRRDLVGDLGKALRKRGLKYAPSYHRERHQSFFAEKLYVVDAKPLPMIREEIKKVPQAASLYGPFGTTKEFVDDYVARWKEIQKKYQPDMLWMDDFPIYTRDGNNVRQGKAKPEIQYMDDQLRAMITDFMNDGATRGADVYVNNKGGNRNWPDGVGCLEKDNLKLRVIGPKWQSCTTFGTSFGYLEGDRYKSVESVIHEMIEVVSRNGNFLINIGPKADGTLVPEQVERLRAMGNWLRINGEAIYGSRYWKVSEQRDEHLVFTTNGKKLYAIKLAQPSAPFTITGTAGWEAGMVKSVRLLGSDSAIGWAMTPRGLTIIPPSDAGRSQHAWAFEIVTDREQHIPNVIPFPM